MTQYPLPLFLLGLLLLIPSCRPVHAPEADAHEHATPMSDLPAHEFSHVTPRRGRH